ncbi:MAG: hypothetical protein HXN81_09985 [Prevotella pallens]|uniref:hypothetical protein n=1 Tax=Prevotella pallens TaxID=60133 RepID=UPI001CB13136|nr:hypothetical protein [Prevotella pallens]MBF1499093.1 hypothetical protein [Prevotella pallens]
MFVAHFVGVRCIINNPFAALRQTTSSRRGRFIVPTYTYSQRIRNPLGHIWQTVSSVIANHKQHYGKPSTAVGDRFIVPAYMNTPTKWGTEMRVRWNINTCAVKWICVFDDVKMRV